MRILVLGLVLLGTVSLAEAQTTLSVAFDEASPPDSMKSSDGAAVGLFPDIVDLLAKEWPGVVVSKVAVPWARAQAMVEHGEADALLTYPSKDRRTYARFSDQPLFTEDIGYLVFRKGSPAATQLRSARAVGDLTGLRMNVTVGSEWEQDNIPSSIARVMSVSDSIKLSVLVKRGDGDFTIMGLEQLSWWARSLNLVDQVDWKRASFLPDSLVPFHFGVRKSLKFGVALVAATNQALGSSQFQKALADLLARYRL